MLNHGVVAAIHVVGVRGDPCGAMRWTPTHFTTRVTMYTHYTYCCHNSVIEHQDLKFSVFFNFKVLKLSSNFNEVQTYSLMMIC